MTVLADALRTALTTSRFLPEPVDPAAIADALQETGTAAAVDTVPLLRAADAFAGALHEVPVHLVVCAALDVLHAVDGRGITAGASIYPFIQNLLMALRG